MDVPSAIAGAGLFYAVSRDLVPAVLEGKISRILARVTERDPTQILGPIRARDREQLVTLLLACLSGVEADEEVERLFGNLLVDSADNGRKYSQKTLGVVRDMSRKDLDALIAIHPCVVDFRCRHPSDHVEYQLMIGDHDAVHGQIDEDLAWDQFSRRISEDHDTLFHAIPQLVTARLLYTQPLGKPFEAPCDVIYKGQLVCTIQSDVDILCDNDLPHPRRSSWTPVIPVGTYHLSDAASELLPLLPDGDKQFPGMMEALREFIPSAIHEWLEEQRYEVEESTTNR